MNIKKADTFKRDLSKIKDKKVTKQAAKAIKLLSTNGQHPSLNMKHIECKRADNLFSIRVNKQYRIMIMKYDEYIEIIRILDHDKYDRLTKGC